jgi:hypothetical protein
MLDVLADPHSGMPYVHIGFKIVLYTSNLFSIDSSRLLLEDKMVNGNEAATAVLR